MNLVLKIKWWLFSGNWQIKFLKGLDVTFFEMYDILECSKILIFSGGFYINYESKLMKVKLIYYKSDTTV